MAEDCWGVMSADELPGPARVLVVEGYGRSREGLTVSLLAQGLSVEAAAGYTEAVRRLGDGRFAFAIIDVDLPTGRDAGLDGWDLARLFRTLHGGAAVMLVTAEWRPELKAAAERLRDCLLLEKPIEPAQLRAMVRRYALRHQ